MQWSFFNLRGEAKSSSGPLSCHATLGREGSRIICLRTLRQHVCFTAKSKNWHENYSSTLQGKMSANEVTTSKKHVKPRLENRKVCGITNQINARAVISNPSRKTNLEKNFQAYCKCEIVFRKGPPVLFTQYLQSFCHIAKLGVHMLSSH